MTIVIFLHFRPKDSVDQSFLNTPNDKGKKQQIHTIYGPHHAWPTGHFHNLINWLQPDRRTLELLDGSHSADRSESNVRVSFFLRTRAQTHTHTQRLLREWSSLWGPTGKHDIMEGYLEALLWGPQIYSILGHWIKPDECHISMTNWEAYKIRLSIPCTGMAWPSLKIHLYWNQVKSWLV